MPINLLGLYVSIISHNLVAQNPRVMLSTFDRAQKPTIAAMQSWANKQIEHMRLQETLQRFVTDALFSVGICKVSLADPAHAAAKAWSLAAGQPFAELVDLDDFVFDVHARSFEEASYIGHRFRVPLDTVKDSRLYTKARKDLVASADSPFNIEGDERISVMGRSYYSTEEFEDMVDLWEIYLPRHRAVVTLAHDDMAGASVRDKDKPLQEKNWIGPDMGPYHMLGFGVIPGSAMPKGPILDLIDLAEAANRTLRKAIRAVDRLKELTLIRGGATEDGSRIMTANDGDILRCDDPASANPIVMGGQHLQMCLGVATAMKDLFGYMAGNLDMMGGLSPQSKTLGQDRMLEENASHGVADMQARTISATADVLKSLCWYWHHDPVTVQRSMHSLPGMPEMQMARSVTPQMRARGKFEDLDIQVDPYSLQHQTPQSRMAALNQVVQQIVTPMMQLLVQQGVNFDINAYLRKISQYMNMPDLADIITIQEPLDQGGAGGGGGGEPRMPAQTNREYTRHNVSERTRHSTDQDMIARMMGHNLGGNPETSKNGTGMKVGV